MAKVDKKKVGFAVFLMITMVLSTIGFIYTGNVSQNTKAEEFRGYEMTSNSGVWQVKLDEENALTFYEDPRVLEKIPYVPINKVDGKVYVAFTPGNDTEVVDQAMQRLDSILRNKGI